MDIVKKSEYEKLCDEAFGKPERQNPLKLLKKYKKLAIGAAAVLVLAVAVLAICLLHKPDLYVHNEVPKPVLLLVERRRGTGFYGKDLNGKWWIVGCDLDDVSEESRCCWITFEETPQKSEIQFEGTQIDYSVTATRCWNILRDDRMYAGRGYDICEFDIDRDGVVETCVLGWGTTSGVASYEFSVWNGTDCEERIFFITEYYTDMAFYSDAEQLKICAMKRSTGNTYLENTIHITYADGGYTLINDAEQVDLLPLLR